MNQRHLFLLFLISMALDNFSGLNLNSDSEIKKEICFGETLIISCGHYEGSTEDDSSSSWSCQETTESVVPEKVRNDDVPFEIKDLLEKETVSEAGSEEDDDFHFFFFHDCDKPLPLQDSKTSVMLVDGFPKINPSAKLPISCSCAKNKNGQCDCFIKLPCKCGAKTEIECHCSKIENICICNKEEPQPECTCRGSDVCLCHPDGKIRIKCTCNMVGKPCICHKNKYPSPVCTCEKKPQNMIPSSNYLEEVCEEYVGLEDFNESIQFEQQPCDCQKSGQTICKCKKGRECTCNENSCICGVQKSCVCDSGDSEELTCINEESKSICSCHIPTNECKCNAITASECKCFHVEQRSCADTEKCQCFSECNCPSDQCICLDKEKRLLKKSPSKDIDVNSMKLKRMRSGKHGFRWCHEVNPRHTYFDYGYNRHDKISYKFQEQEKLKILGLGDEKLENVDTCPENDTEIPLYKKKLRKPSMDCCSAVGGISINVETLGEDKDKFLVQVVSHSSKEDAITGSKLVSILDCQLHTMEENRTEYVTKNFKFKERRSYMTICENGYYNKVTRVCGEHDVVKRLYHSFDESRRFLLEGANIVLLRYFGLRRYKGTVKTETVLMDGTVCESIYVCLGVSQAIVNGKPLFVVKVERHIIEPSGRLHQTLTVLSLRGYTISHEWADSVYMLHINPLLRVVPEKDEIEPHPPLRERWREDLQLLSDYLDFKSSRSSEGERYMTESGALTSTMRDYLQAILLLRPGDILDFTRHYFGATLSAIDLPHDEYFDPTTKHVRYYFFEE